MNSSTQENEKEMSSFRNMSYSKRDIYYRKAKEEGFRARSVYKLKEIQENYKILLNAVNFVDLCAAPGSWTQMLRILTKQNSKAKIVSVDIQDIVPIEGVTLIKGDITRQETIEKILSNFNNEKVDIIIFDGAPDVTGLIDVDLHLQIELIVFSLIICMKILKEGGKFVAKIFKVNGKEDNESIGSNLQSVKCDFYYEKVKMLFDNVFYFKPSSSRSSSHESYLVCEGYSLENKEIQMLIENTPLEKLFDYNGISNKELSKLMKFIIQGLYDI